MADLYRLLTEDDIQVTMAPNAGPRAAEEDRLPARPSKISGHFRFPAGKQKMRAGQPVDVD
ncbi:MAG: hypothetical protein K6U04_14445 [Armatimonadetes bacterium]|nr:hypothetical protein [Armatimonadota bacterium]